MGRRVDLDDIIDSDGVARVLGLSSETGRNTVRQYRQRHPDFPQPVLRVGGGRCLLWLRPEVEEWRRRHPGRR
jgi:predicted DNA-binding transcriptional regulator AlpA